jgi:ribosomal protein S18 acetylase RimI-like enzyme
MAAKEQHQIQTKCTRLEPGDIQLLAGIDRSEHVTRAYELNQGQLTLVAVDWQVPNFFTEGDGDHSLAHQIAFCNSHLDQGGVLLGAFTDQILVGMAVVRPQLHGDMAQLAFLHVSRDYRRHGIAMSLMDEACHIARTAGAARLYISAIPSESAVGFYLSRGSVLADPVDPELYALEPEDIHLILDL